MPIELNVSHRGTTHRLSLLPNDTITALQARLEELTSMPPSLQKLLYKGKKPHLQDDDTLSQAGFKNGIKIQLIGPTAEELGGMRAVEDERNRRERIMRERAAKSPIKVRPRTRDVRSTGSPMAESKYEFHRIEALNHLPDPPAARTLLTRLANDPAIRHVMQKHSLAVGVLTELAPHEHPNLLGLNVNAGQAIKLRLRTDRYDGFRLYGDVRKVLCHELTHNVWGDHDDNFKEMNSRLNRDVLEFERSLADGTHTFMPGDAYEPSSELEAEANALITGSSHVLGGSGPASTDESSAERRTRILEATMNRLRKEEEELEGQCGTSTTH
ncbi:hypothetical protein IEO21_02900 [Rhodonia placenta]|uniref:WLM domain-containing protein n=1 Tax=Rhodonia placenta TaxID=104341 RepID=A0A8H7U4P7_9APHY|nr:hypothetical protein IEO21_02900 [Postia placenta]